MDHYTFTQRYVLECSLKVSNNFFSKDDIERWFKQADFLFHEFNRCHRDMILSSMKR